uniref:Caspase recruitment domain family member 19 n=1 Tax=Neogobius melanostomus TaxID=47308 RepID=A0A8C6THY3_9GOBI
DPDDYSRQLLMDLNRTYPQILCDKEAHKFRNLRVLTKLRLAELLRNLHCKGEEACHEFYRGLQIHAEDLFCRLPSRVRYQGKKVKVVRCLCPMFFLSCFSLVVGVAILYYYGEEDTLNCSVPWLHCSARKLGKGAKHFLLSYAEVGKHNIL